MSSTEYSRKLDELDRLLNDPDVPMQPDRIWALLADVSRPDDHPEIVNADVAASAQAGCSVSPSHLTANSSSG